MPKHVSTVARSELVRARVITRSHSVEASSRFSVHLSSAPRLRTPFRTTPEQTSAAVQRFLVGQNDRAKRCKSAAAAEPIAFARTDIAEPEEEDFYSILGVVRFFSAFVNICLGYVHSNPDPLPHARRLTMQTKLKSRRHIMQLCENVILISAKMRNL